MSKPGKDNLSRRTTALPAQFHLPDICTLQSLLFAVLAGSLLAIVFALVGGNSHLPAFDWLQFALIAFFVLWVVLLSVALLCRLRPYLGRLNLVQGVLASYVIILTITLLVSLLSQWMMTAFLGRERGFDFWLTLEQVLVAAILAGVSLRYLYLQELLHVQQKAELAARIQALQSRIRPHFLFNSMNIIASLIESDPALAERVVEDLAVLFRATLSEAGQLVPLAQEIDLAKNYLNIEALRLGERLKVDWQIDMFDADTVLPQLSLQPLLENAIYHGIQPLPQGGTITVHILNRNGRIEVAIRNPVAADIRPREGNRIALENLRHRLQAYYGGSARFTAEQQGSQFEVTLSCPLTPIPPARA